MSMNVYGLREAKTLIVKERKKLAADFPRSNDPYVRGQRDALKKLDDALSVRIQGYMPADNLPKLIA